METIRYSLIGKEDLFMSPRDGRMEVTLADGRVVILSALDVAYLIGDAYTKAGLPAAGTPGAIARVTDSVRGLWMDTGQQWASLSGETILVREFNARADGETDDAPAIQAAIDALPATGGVVYFPVGTYRIASTLTITKPGVTLRGAAAFATTDVGSLTTSGTILQWGGTRGGTLLDIAPVQSASGQGLKQIGLDTLVIDGNLGLAGIGLRCRSISFSDFRNLYILNCGTVAWDMNTVTTLGELRDTHRNVFTNICIRQFEDGASSAIGIRLGGDDTLANTSYNRFYGVQVHHINGIGVQFRNSDNNAFYGLCVFRPAGGTALGIELQAGTEALLTARNNYFFHVSAGDGGLTARGTPTNTVASLLNWAYGYETSNGEPVPAIEAGAIFRYISDRAIVAPLQQVGIGDSPTGAVAAMASIGTASLAIYNVSENQILLGDASHIWGLNIQGGFFRIQRVAGSGLSGIILPAVSFSQLGSPNDGVFAYCADCAIASPCTGGGTGAFAKRLAGVWVCN